MDREKKKIVSLSWECKQLEERTSSISTGATDEWLWKKYSSITSYDVSSVKIRSRFGDFPFVMAGWWCSLAHDGLHGWMDEFLSIFFEENLGSQYFFYYRNRRSVIRTVSNVHKPFDCHGIWPFDCCGIKLKLTLILFF